MKTDMLISIDMTVSWNKLSKWLYSDLASKEDVSFCLARGGVSQSVPLGQYWTLYCNYWAIVHLSNPITK